MKKVHTSSKNRGSALVLIIVAMVILMVTGIGLLAVGYNSRLLAIKDNAALASHAAADAGVFEAVCELNNKLATKEAAFMAADNNSTLPSMTIQTPLGPDSGNQKYAYRVSDTWPNYTISSTGASNGVERKISAKTTVSGPFDPAILVANQLTMNNNDIVGAAQGTEVTVGTLSSSAGAISAGNGSVINGNVFCPPDASPESVISAPVGSGFSKFQAEEQMTMAPVFMPAFGTTPLDVTYSANTTLSNPSYDFNNLTLANNVTLTISGNVTLRIAKDLSMGNNGGISVVGANSKLTIYIGGNIGPGTNSFELTNSTGSAAAVKIYGTKTSLPPQVFNFKNSSTLVAAIYAPFADVTFMNNPNITGSIICNNLTLKNNMVFTYDDSIRDSYKKTDPGVHIVVSNWQEQ